jgi:DNA-binding response OmpR family regulator
MPCSDRSPGATVLVVEDDLLVRLQIAGALRDAGWNVFEASSGEDALGLVRDGQPIDLLITDIQLIGCFSGWDLAESVRAERSDLPVIYASGNPVNESRKVAGSLFFAKPFRTTELLEACNRLGRARR